MKQKRLNIIYNFYKNYFIKKKQNPFQYFIILELFTNIKANKLKIKFINKELKLNLKLASKVIYLLLLLKFNYSWEYYFKKTFIYNSWWYILKPVFIPRDFTTKMIYKIYQNWNKKAKEVIEFGIGSGIHIAKLSKIMKNCNFIGIEIDRRAIKVAKNNIISNKLKNIKVIKNNWTDSLKFKTKFDVIYSNPPYVERKWKKHSYESNLSIYGNFENCNKYFKDIFIFANNYLKADGEIYLELSDVIFKNIKNDKFYSNYKFIVLYKEFNVLIIKCIKII